MIKANSVKLQVNNNLHIEFWISWQPAQSFSLRVIGQWYENMSRLQLMSDVFVIFMFKKLTFGIVHILASSICIAFFVIRLILCLGQKLQVWLRNIVWCTNQSLACSEYFVQICEQKAWQFPGAKQKYTKFPNFCKAVITVFCRIWQRHYDLLHSFLYSLSLAGSKSNANYLYLYSVNQVFCQLKHYSETLEHCHIILIYSFPNIPRKLHSQFHIKLTDFSWHILRCLATEVIL